MRTTPIVLSDKQEKWLNTHFKNTKNEDIAEKLGISLRSVIRLARKRDLAKTTQFMKKSQMAAASAARISHLAHGTYPPKGFRIPNSEKGQFVKGTTPLERLGKKKERLRQEKSAASLKETRRKEKARITFGLPQKTNLRIYRQPTEKVRLRHYLKTRGYIVDDDERVVYYNENTMRGKRIESKQQPWYTFLPERNQELAKKQRHSERLQKN